MEKRPSPVQSAGDRLSAVVFCEDSQLSAAPAETIQCLTRRFLGEIEIEASLWQFEALTSPTVEATATRSAAGAPLIGVASSDRSELPSHVRSILSRSLAARLDQPTAVMLFLTGDQKPAGQLSAGQVSSYLRRLARQSGAAFFATIIPSLHGTPRRPSHPWQHSSPGPHHWGLNE